MICRSRLPGMLGTSLVLFLRSFGRNRMIPADKFVTGFMVGFLLLFLTGNSFGQMDTLSTLELSIGSDEYPYYLLPAGENGLVVYRERQQEVQEEYHLYDFQIYDANLNKVWETLLRMDYMLEAIQHTRSGDHVYVLFSGVKNFRKRLFIYHMNLVTHTQDNIEIETFFPGYITYFGIFGNTVVLGGREKSKPSIVFYPLDNMRPVILQGFYEKNMTVHDLDIDEENELFTVTAGFMTAGRQLALHIKSYDRLGVPVEDMRIVPDDGIDLIHAKSMIADRNYRLVTGIYQNMRSANSKGIFSMAIRLDGTRISRYYTIQDVFSRLDSLYGPDAGDISGYFARDSRIQWQVTDLMEFRDDNIVLFESHYTEKAGESFMDKNLLYHYQKALIIALDDDLEMRGFSRFGLSPIVSDRLERNLQVRPYPDSLKFTLFDRYKVAEKTITGEHWNSPVFITELGDEWVRELSGSIENDYFIDFRHWFGNFYLLTGLFPSKGRVADKQLVINKIYYP